MLDTCLRMRLYGANEFWSINQFSLRTEIRLNLRSPSHYVKMLLASHQIERKRGKQNNQMQQSTAITRDKVLRVYVTNVYAKIIMSVQRYNDALNSQSKPPLSKPTRMSS